MSISIYYTARRDCPMSPAEETEIANLIAKYSVDLIVSKYMATGEGLNWESFCVYPPDPKEPRIIFEGATRLPDNTSDALWEGTQHWCELLSGIRRVIESADWSAHIDDHDLVWDGKRREYDPTQ